LTVLPAIFRTSRLGRALLLTAIAFASLGALCDPPAKATDITRERAIEIARKEVNIPGESVEAVQVASEGRTLWRVTIKGRLPDAPPGLFETRIVDIDARTGEIVSMSTS
jgi:uncharacterized membrane protein YkoI